MLEETAARAVWDHSLDIGLANTVRMTTQATEEYLSVGVTTASAGGMPSSLPVFCGLHEPTQSATASRSALPLFEKVERACYRVKSLSMTLLRRD